MKHILIGCVGAVLAWASAAVTQGPVTPEMRSADVVILGEIHDNPHHSRVQARIIRDLAPEAVVFEFLAPKDAAALTPSLARDPGKLDALFDAVGWPEGGRHAPLMQAAAARRVIGMALPRDDVRRAVTDGAAQGFGADAARFGLDQPLAEPELTQRKDLQFQAHCEKLPTHLLGGMVEAQRLRDAHFARVVLATRVETTGPVVVIAGSGHARKDWGIPRFLARVAADLAVVSVQLAEPGGPDTEDLFDHRLELPKMARDDPCAAFD